MEIVACKQCNIEKELCKTNFKFIKRRNKFDVTCVNCRYKKEKERRNKIKDILKIKRKEYYESNKEKFAIYGKDYRNKNIEIIHEKDRKRKRKYKSEEIYIKKRLNTGFNFRSLTQYIKNGYNCKYLPYTIKELKNHLEAQFKPWMSWNNIGKYSYSKWNDNDQATWTWQLDHIIPYSEFTYNSSTDEDFKKCWALENLRPLSSKINIIEGSRRDRHKDKRRYRVIIIKDIKPKYTQEEIDKVKELFDKGHGSRLISKQLGFTRWKVQMICRLIENSKKQSNYESDCLNC